VVQTLLNNNVFVNTSDHGGVSASHDAFEGRRRRRVVTLYRFDTHPTVLCQRSVLHYAVHSLRLCEKLVAAKADVQRRDHQQNTPLHEACCHRGRTDVIAFLLEQRADINAANKCAQTKHNRVRENKRKQAAMWLLKAPLKAGNAIGAWCVAVPT
jgi:ankyrin repeat protein